MGRTDRASVTMAAPRPTVYAALLDARALEAWLPPSGMRGRIEDFDPRPGGGFRLELTYLDPEGAPGKTTGDTDVTVVAFGELVPDSRVEWRSDFVADDPAFAGTMTMTWSLSDTADGTLVEVCADDVPPGIDADVHRAGIASSLANLAEYVASG